MLLRVPMGPPGVSARAARRVTAVSLATAALLPGGCGSDKEPTSLRGDTRQIAQVVAALGDAAQRRDFRTVCRDLFTRSARRRAGGRDCEELLRSTAGEIRLPRMQLLGIEVKGQRAEARVRTFAAGQPAIVDRILFAREGSEWRIDALAG